MNKAGGRLREMMGYYGDYVCELDWAVGQIMDALERNGMIQDTIVIFTTDNGPERQCYGYVQDYDHYSMGEWRGVKRDLWEGGHRTEVEAERSPT